MKKIICDICGTTYPDTAQQCPICGYANNPAQQMGGEQPVESSRKYVGSSERVRGGRFSEANVRKRNRQTPQNRIQEPEEADDYFEQEDVPSQSNPVLVSLLVIVIVALLVVTGIIFFRYYLPNNLPEATTESTEESTLSTGESTVPTVPCTALAITDGAVAVELKNAGDKHLVNVMVLPADTTDELVYTSSNEAVATVNSEGRVTAVGEGEAVITVSCGSQSITCTVTCDFTTEAAETDEDPTGQTE